MACIAAAASVVDVANVNNSLGPKADIPSRPTVCRLVVPLPEITIQTLSQRAQHRHTYTPTHVRTHV